MSKHKPINSEKPVNWRRQQGVFIGLLLGIFVLAGLLAVRYDRQWDLTHNQRNALSKTSIELVQKLTAPVHVTAFVRGNPKVKQLTQRIIARYQRHGDFVLQFQNPDLSPDVVSQYHISRDGELLLRYQGNSQVAKSLTETAISQVLHRLLKPRRHVVFLSGHGERDVADNPTGYGKLLKQLDAQAISVSGLNLQNNLIIPPQTDVVVIAAPKQPYSEAAQQALIDYVGQGGRLLWLSEANTAQLPQLSAYFGVMSESAVLRNQSAKAYGLHGDGLIVITPTLALPMFQGIDKPLVFSQMTWLKTLPTQARETWLALPILAVTDNTVVQRGQDLSMASLPLTVGLQLTPKTPKVTEPRGQAVYIADSDFLSNRFIGLGQNSDFAKQLFGQLSTADLPILTNTTQPSAVVLSEAQLTRQILLYVVLVPLLILLLGWRLRRRLCSE